MFINIRELEPKGLRFDDEIAVPPFRWEGGQTVSCGPVRLVGTLTPSSRGLEMLAELRTATELTCSRCLEPYAREVSTSFRLFIIEVEDESATIDDTSSEEESDAVDVYTMTGEQLDIADVIREQIDLALPVTAVCSQDCRGYCPGCGALLNEEKCRCKPLGGGTWSELREIREALLKKRGRDGSKGD